MNFSKPSYKSKTIWANMIMAVIAIVAIASKVIPVQYVPYAVLAGAILNIILRFLTDQPITLQDVEDVAVKAPETPPKP